MESNIQLTQEQVKKLKSADLAKDLPSAVMGLEAARQGTNDQLPVDISLSEFVKGKYGLDKDDFLNRLGISMKVTTMNNVFSMPGTDYRWVVPEIIRDAIVLGMKSAPFYNTVIASDQPVKSLSVIMPFVNQSDAAPARVNEGETIPLGTISFGQKSVTLFKVGKGFKLTDEVRNYVSLDVLSIFVRDFGVQLGYSLDSLAIDTLINGNKGDGSESAPVIGVRSTTDGIVYKDLLRLWVRAARLGRSFKTIIGGEDQAIELLDLPEFKDRHSGTTAATLNVKTPVPKSADFYIHPGVPDTSILLLDPSAALIKLTARQLGTEAERIVSNQTSAIYSTITTGFSKMYRDAAVLIDSTEEFDGFPADFDVDAFLNVQIEGQ